MKYLKFIISKIKRYGLLGIWGYTFTKYWAAFLYTTSLGRYYVINNRGIKYRYYHTSVSKLMMILPTIHDGDVDELKSLSKQGSIIIDVGANIGTTSIPLSKYVGVHGKIIAIEANPKIANCLRENIKLNGVKNIEVLQIAVGESSKLVRFSDIDIDDINKVEGGNIKNANSANVLVPMMRLDDMLKDFEKIDVIKIDVEGYEKFVLAGATETLKKTKAVYMEYYEPNTLEFGYKREELKNTLEQAGFVCTLSDLSKHVIDVDNLIAVRR